MLLISHLIPTATTVPPSALLGPLLLIILRTSCISFQRAISTASRDLRACKMVRLHEICSVRLFCLLMSKPGAYKAWALQLPSLTVVPGFPVLIQGAASNDPQK